MLDLLNRLFGKPREDVFIDNPAVVISFDRRTRVVYMFCFDPATQEATYAGLEKHYAKQGYFLQLFAPSVSVPRPEREE